MFLAKLYSILSPFHARFRKFVAFSFLYESVSLVEPMVAGLMIQLLHSGVTVEMLYLYLGLLLLYEEVFLRLDAKRDWMIMVGFIFPIYSYLRIQSVKVLLALDSKWHQKNNSGALAGKIHSGTDKVTDNIIGSYAWELLPLIFQALLYLVIVSIKSPLSAVLVLTANVLFIGLTIKQFREQNPIREERHDTHDHDYRLLHAAAGLRDTIVRCVQQERFLGEYEEIHQRLGILAEREQQLGQYKYGLWKARVASFSRRVVVIILAHQVVVGTVSIPEFVILMELVSRLSHSIWRASRIYENTARVRPAVERLYDLLRETPEITDPVSPARLDAGDGIEVKFDSVTFSYNGQVGDSALQGFSTIFKAGSTVGVVGPSGSGKTTLGKLLTRMWEPSEGRILVNGVSVRDLSLDTLRSLFAFVPQGGEVDIFDASMEYNLCYGKPESSYEQMKWAARMANLEEFIEQLPNGYNTILGERGVRLSGGQKQRVALARALLMDRPMLVLDEATSSLDSINEREIQEQIGPYLRDRGRTVIIIAHNLSTLQGVVDRILVMEEGKLVEEGTQEELLKRCGLYARLWETQRA